MDKLTLIEQDLSKIDPEKREFMELMERAYRGDRAACKAVFERADPQTRQRMIDGLTDSGKSLREVLYTNVLQCEAFGQKMQELTRDLAPQTAMERLLVERIVICWLELHRTEMEFAKGEEAPERRHWEGLLDRAEKRHQKAILSLATLRRLSVPVVQINVAQTGLGGSRSPPVARIEEC